MVKCRPVYSTARCGTVAVVLGRDHHAFKGKIILCQGNRVIPDILADDYLLCIRDKSQAGDAYDILAGLDILDSEFSFSIGNSPLLGRHEQNSGILHRLACTFIQDRTAYSVRLVVLGRQHSYRQADKNK